MKKITLLFAVLLTAQFINGQCAVGNTEITGDANHTITFADDVDFANNSLGTFTDGVAYGGWTLTNSGTATGVGKIVNDAEKGKVFEYEITAVGGANGDAKLISDNSCSILTGTTSEVNFKIYFDLKSNQVDNSTKGDMIWKVGLTNGSIQQKRFIYSNTDGAWETYAGTKTYAVTPNGDTRMFFRIDFGKVGNVGRKFWIANVSMEYTSNDSGITLDNETFNSGALVSLYPNPVDNNLNIDTAEELKSVKVFDITGHLVKQVEGNVGNVIVGEFNPGIYLVQLTNANGETVTSKFVKK